MSLTLQLGIRHITVEKLQTGSEFVTIFGKILYNANNTTFRAICKMIISFYMQNGGNRENISHLLPYILGDSQENCVFYYYPDRTFTTTNDSFKILHQLFIKGSSTEKIIYGYVELFSTFKFLVLLSNDYIGNDFCKEYSFDVMERDKIESNINIDLCKNSISEIKESQQKNINKFKNALDELRFFIDQKQSEEHISNIVQTSIENVFKGIEEGSTINEDDYIRLIDNFLEKFAHFLNFKNRNF